MILLKKMTWFVPTDDRTKDKSITRVKMFILKNNLASVYFSIWQSQWTFLSKVLQNKVRSLEYCTDMYFMSFVSWVFCWNVCTSEARTSAEIHEARPELQHRVPLLLVRGLISNHPSSLELFQDGKLPVKGRVGWDLCKPSKELCNRIKKIYYIVQKNI